MISNFPLLSICLICGLNMFNSANIPVRSRTRRIINGVEASMVPYYVKLSIVRSFLAHNNRIIKKNVQICGGTLISNLYVLTAAHCIYKRILPEVIISLGSTDFSPKSEETQRYSTTVTLHEDFNWDTLQNDIALIRLGTEINMVEMGLEAVRLPRQIQDYELQTGLICGFGIRISWFFAQQNRTLMVPSKKLLCTNITISSLECLRHNVSLPAKSLCAIGSGGSDGDSGGGLIVNGVLIGIFAATFHQNSPFGPGMYTNVAYFLDWIHRVTGIPNR